MTHWLAQSSTQSLGDMLIWVIILGAFVASGGIVILWLRARMVRDDDGESSPSGLLEQLRRSHQRGQITQDEFRLARDRLLEGVAGRPRARQKLLRGEVHDDGSIRSRPGFDLLGDPLPPPSQPPETDQPPHAPR